MKRLQGCQGSTVFSVVTGLAARARDGSPRSCVDVSAPVDVPERGQVQRASGGPSVISGVNLSNTH